MHAALTLALLISATGTTTATEALQTRDRQIRASLPPSGTALSSAEREKVEKTVVDLVDLDQIAQSALQETWTKQPPAKRAKFMHVFSQRFRRAATEQLDFYRTTDTKFEPEKKSEQGVLVPTTLTIKGEPTNVTYLMRPVKGGGWKIEDIIIDDVSTVENYRATFHKIVAENGFDGLIAKLSKGEEK